MKRNKKYNAMKNKHVIRQSLMKKLHQAIMYIGGDQYSGMVNIKTGKREEWMRPEIIDTPYKWTIYLAVFMRESNGKLNTKIWELPCSQPLLHSQVCRSVLETHLDMINEWRTKAPNNFVNIGWLATPYESDIADRVEEIFHLNGAYDNKYEFEG